MQDKNKNSKEITGKKIIDFLVLVLAGVMLGLLLINLFGTTEVYGNSMFPTLESNDKMFINKVTYKFNEPERGDIIVFNSTLKDAEGNNKSLIKRIVGIPGDHVYIRDGRVFINGKLQEESYLDSKYTKGYIDITLEKDKYFVMGDNRSVSRDSRDKTLGPIDKSDIVGKANIRYAPFRDSGIVE